jgi:hypothetical protein
MKYLNISIGIFIALAASRFVPHPPNFTSLIALSFYVPVLFGKRYLLIVILAFAITDLYFGFHNTLLFTWFSVLIIGLISTFFKKSLYFRMSGAALGALAFFVITNFGVWATGMYGYTFDGLIACYTLAIPFFAYSLISTIIFSSLIETAIFFVKKNFKIV